MLNEGDMVPDLALDTPDGGRFTLAQARGRALVLYFYPKDDTPGCTTEGQDFSARTAAFEMAGATVLGVSKDTPAKHAKFIAKYGFTHALASDDGSVCEAFGTWIEKSLYGRKYMGIDRATFLIDAEGRIAKAWRKVKVPGHAEAVLEAARALQAG